MMKSWLAFSLLALAPAAEAAPRLEKALFAGGCFWCMTPPFEKLDGVAEVLSGYADGRGKDPAYEDYAERGFVEVVQVTFDPAKVSYDRLLGVFWRQIDPTDAGGQFVDRGPQYRSVIYYLGQDQKKSAEASRASLSKSGRFERPIATEIRPAPPFYKAEDYHQGYHKKNPVRYRYYRYRSGRDQFLQKAWGTMEKPGANLTPLQYKVTRENGTEPPFDNEYWDNRREGVYVDIVSGEPLFSSLDKFESGTGWPSFTRPLEPNNVLEREDRGLFAARTEVRSRGADSHLGHVFPDGPRPTGLRYCINSAALRFVPKEDLKKEGLERYAALFKKR